MSSKMLRAQTPKPKGLPSVFAITPLSPTKLSNLPKSKTKTNPSPPTKSFLGCNVLKRFTSFGWFYGRVTKLNEDGSWTVLYTDKDTEDYSEEDLLPLMHNYDADVNMDDSDVDGDAADEEEEGQVFDGDTDDQEVEGVVDDVPPKRHGSSKNGATSTAPKNIAKNNNNPSPLTPPLKSKTAPSRSSKWLATLKTSSFAKVPIGRSQKLDEDYDLGENEEFTSTKTYATKTGENDEKYIVQYHRFCDNNKTKKPWAKRKASEGTVYPIGQVWAFIKYLIIDSEKFFEEFNVHKYTTGSIRWGPLAALKRAAIEDDSKNKRYNDVTAWQHLCATFYTQSKLAGLPLKGDDMFIANQIFLSYILALSPQGANYYPHLAAYISILRIGVRRGMLNQMRLKSITSVTKLDSSPQSKKGVTSKQSRSNPTQNTEICLKLKYGKGWHIRRKKIAYILGTEAPDPLTAPNPYNCLNDLVSELYGMSLHDLEKERLKNSKWWSKHKNNLLFEGCGSVYFGGLLKTISDLAGMPTHLRLSMYFSPRSGALDAAISHVDKKIVGPNSVNATFGWTGDKLAEVADTHYGGRGALESRVYANKVTEYRPDVIYRADVGKANNASSSLHSRDGPLTPLVDILKRNPLLRGVKFIDDPTSMTKGYPRDYDIIKMLILPAESPNTTAENKHTAARALRHAVAIAAVMKLDVDPNNKSEQSLINLGKAAVLSKLRGMSRQDMKKWILANIVRYYDQNGDWKSKKIWIASKLSDNTKSITFVLSQVKKAYNTISTSPLKTLLTTVRQMPGEGTFTMAQIAAHILKSPHVDQLTNFAKKHSLTVKRPDSVLSKSDSKRYTFACKSLSNKEGRTAWSSAAENELLSFLSDNDGVLLLRIAATLIVSKCSIIREEGRSSKSIHAKIANLKEKAARCAAKDERKAQEEETSSDEDPDNKERSYSNNKRRARQMRNTSDVDSSEEENDADDGDDNASIPSNADNVSDCTASSSSSDDSDKEADLPSKLKKKFDTDSDTDSQSSDKRGSNNTSKTKLKKSKSSFKAGSSLRSSSRSGTDDEYDEDSEDEEPRIPAIRVRHSTHQRPKHTRTLNRPNYKESGDGTDSDTSWASNLSDEDDAEINLVEPIKKTSKQSQSTSSKAQSNVMTACKGSSSSSSSSSGGSSSGRNSGNGRSGRNLNINGKRSSSSALQQLGIPQLGIFTGAWPYDPQLPYTHQVVNGVQRPLHGYTAPAPVGFGVPIDQANVAYTCGQVFTHLWIIGNADLNNVGVRTAVRTGGWCDICGFKIRQRQTYYFLSPESGKANQIRYCHYPCFTCRVFDYPYARMQAATCCQNPPTQRWGLSVNAGHQKPLNAPQNWAKWVYCEKIDLFVALKLTGYLPVQPRGPNVVVNNPIDWDRVLSFAPVCRCNMKTAQQLQTKWINEHQHMFRYMTILFFQANIGFNFVNHM